MSEPTSRGDLPTERDDPALTDDRPTGLAGYDATPDALDDDVIDISDNSGPELTTGVADWAPGAGSGGARRGLAAEPGDDTGGSGGHGTVARDDDTGAETPPQALPDDEP